MQTEAHQTKVKSETAQNVGDKKHSPESQEDPQKHAVLEIITEFIESANIDQAVTEIEKRKIIEGIEFVKRALIFGIEHKAYERELISQLLSAVYNIFNINEMSSGFQLVLDRLPDLVLDVPDAAEVLGKFLSRAVFDEILPPIFLEESNVKSESAQRALSLAKNTSNDTDDRKRLEYIWGPGDLSSVNRLRDAVDTILKEYLDTYDLGVASKAVKELNSPSFNSQVLKQALVLAIERNTENHQTLVLDLIKGFSKISLVSAWDIRHSFDLTWRRVHDLKLDVPNAIETLTQLTKKAKTMKVLADDFAVPSE